MSNKKKVETPVVNKKVVKTKQSREYKSMSRLVKIMLMSPFKNNRVGVSSWTKDLRKFFCTEDKPRMMMEYDVKPRGLNQYN